MLDYFELRLAKERLLSGNSPIQGLGVFTRVGFRHGELLTILQGEIISIPELKSRYRKGIERISDPLQISERLYLDMDKPFVYINHSCAPNTAVVGKNNLVTLRPIEKGEEITYDYSLTEWTWERFGKYAEWDMKCACGAPSCRGRVTQFPFMPTALKMRYFRQGALPDFIIRKVIKKGLAS